MTKHWSEEPYWTEAIERFDANRERGTQLFKVGFAGRIRTHRPAPAGYFARVGLDLAPDLAVVGGILRHHVRERERLCHRVRCRAFPAAEHGLGRTPSPCNRRDRPAPTRAGAGRGKNWFVRTSPASSICLRFRRSTTTSGVLLLPEYSTASRVGAQPAGNPVGADHSQRDWLPPGEAACTRRSNCAARGRRG